jgi:hypothetical protein
LKIKKRDLFEVPFFYLAKSVLSVGFNFVVAIAAIDRSAVARFERDLRVFAALRASYFIQLAGRGTVAAASIAVVSVAAASAAAAAKLLSFPCLAAGRAALGLIGVASGCELFLFVRGKGKSSVAI